MHKIEPETRSASRRALDEKIAAEPALPPPQLPPDAAPAPVEDHLRSRQRHPLALPGVVENGMIRLIDPGVTLPERSRVIVVAEST
jgi:hypothetical protein